MRRQTTPIERPTQEYYVIAGAHGPLAIPKHVGVVALPVNATNKEVKDAMHEKYKWPGYFNPATIDREGSNIIISFQHQMFFRLEIRGSLVLPPLL